MLSKNKTNRIIFFLPNFSRGGASESIFKLSKFLINHNYSILIVSLGKNFYKKEFKKINCDVIELKKKRALFSIFKLRNLIKKEIKKKYKKTILISNIHYANIISIISCFKLKKIKIILTERSSLTELNISNNIFEYLKKRLIFFLAKYFYKFANLIITNSQFEKKFIKKTFGIKKIECIHPPSINNVNNTKKYKKKLNLFNKIIYVGRLSKEKGVITILKSLLELREHNYTFNIYGDGAEKENLQKFVYLNNLKKKIFFKGFAKDKDFIFKDANLFINASWFEGLPNALVQSINYNVFPICANSPGGNNEVVKNGKLGLLFKVNNVADLKKKILFFIKNKLKINQSIKMKHLKKYTEKKSNQSYLKTLNKL